MATSTEAERTRAFAKRYVDLVEALVREGVREKTAREEAFKAAMIVLQMADAESAPCPLCGHGMA